MPRKMLFAVGGFLWIFTAFSVLLCAQQSETQRSQQDTASSGRGSNSLVEDLFSNARSRIGFSVGLYEMYQSNVYTTSSHPITANITTISPRVFINLGKRKTKFRVDFGVGYYRYHNREGLDSFDYSGNADFDRQLSRNFRFRIADYFSSSTNGYGGLSYPLHSSIGIAPGFSTELLVRRQRILSNRLNVSLAYSKKKNRVSAYGSIDSYIFKTSAIRDVNAFQIGATYDRQLTRWLFLSNGYSTYLNQVDPRFQNQQIHRLQVGGIKFKLGDYWQLNLGSGVEFVKINGEYRWRENANVSLDLNTKSHVFSVQYHRGFFSSVGISGIMQSDQVSALLGSRLTERLNAQFNIGYVRGSNYYSYEATGSGQLNYYYGQGSLQYALFRGMVASLSASYRDQRIHNIGGLQGDLNTYVLSAGVQYVFPSSRR